MANEETKPIRFGILGCVEIARKVSRAINLSPNATLYAIGSRSIEKVTKFSASNNFPSHAKVYGSYNAVLDDPGVDVVYIPLPTSLHLHWAVLAAQNKKHLLLHKPVALNVVELDKILEACQSNGCYYVLGLKKCFSLYLILIFLVPFNYFWFPSIGMIHPSFPRSKFLLKFYIL